ncbi:MAG: DUF4293 domain-containing protein [Flavobacteriales bacterium]|nr:DUF4293 domain-containing protein [Flavobacteriales bacterium]
MLQRIQTLYILFALAAVGSSLAFDWVTYTVNGETSSFMTDSNAIVMQVLVGLSGITSITVIARFKNRKAQMKLANVAMLDMLVIFAAFGFLHYQQIQSFAVTEGLDLSYDLAPALPIVALVLLWMAKKGIKKDDDLVRSVDRLR